MNVALLLVATCTRRRCLRNGDSDDEVDAEDDTPKFDDGFAVGKSFPIAMRKATKSKHE